LALVIETGWLSISVAESLVMAVWLVLERHNMPLPALAMQFSGGGDLVKITMTFDSSQHAEKVRRAIDHLIRASAH
jgi:hypothetical protein